MSFFPGKDPAAGDAYQCDAISQVIVPRTVDLGEFARSCVALPSAQTRMVGPFIFFDHFGTGGVPRRQTGSTFARIAHRARHRDLSFRRRDHAPRQSRHRMAIRLVEVNWMTAGRGIVHSERDSAGATRRR